jgi:hypothetical protein
MQTLEQWLEVATRGLCESAAERVRAEIGEHYASALESAALDGVDPLDADRLAVDALGDAKIANRQYRRVLLTESEEDVLRRCASRGGRLWHRTLVVLSAVLLVVVPISTLGVAKYTCAAILVEALLRAIPVASIRAGWVVRILRWVNSLVFYTMWFASTLAFARFAAALIPVMAVGTMQMEYRLFVIRRKLPVEQWPRRLWV